MTTSGERGGLLGWLMPMSIALHVALVVWLPRGGRASNAHLVLPPPVIEIAEAVLPVPKIEEVPPPAPIEPRPEPVRMTTPTPTRAPQPLEQAATPSRAPPAPPSNERTASTDAPLDFTATALSNEGPGIVVGGNGGGGTRGGSSRAAMVASAPATASAPPTFVPASSLSKAPRAPGLDAALERNYPADARRSGISGRAMLRVAIHADGRVGRVVKVSESFAGFGEACAKTVRDARWEPPLDRDGRAVATEITYVCEFEVRS